MNTKNYSRNLSRFIFNGKLLATSASIFAPLYQREFPRKVSTIMEPEFRSTNCKNNTKVQVIHLWYLLSVSLKRLPHTIKLSSDLVLACFQIIVSLPLKRIQNTTIHKHSPSNSRHILLKKISTTPKRWGYVLMKCFRAGYRLKREPNQPSTWVGNGR